MRLYFDGASRGNPGLAGAGVVIYSGNSVVIELSEFLGIQTNNYAEYRAVLLGVRWLFTQYSGDLEELIVIGDSQLIIRQLLGRYKVRSTILLPLYNEVVAYLSKLSETGWQISYRHIKRHFNKRADALANAAIDNSSSS